MVGFWWEPSMFQTANFSQYPSVVKTEGESSLGFLLLMCPTLWQPHRLQPARLLSPWDFSILSWVAISFSRDLPDSGIKPVSPALQADSLLLSYGEFFFFYKGINPFDGGSTFLWGFPGGSEVRASACNAGDPGSIPGSGRSPGEGNDTHSSILSWRTPWTEEPGRLQSTGLQRVKQDWATSLSLSTFIT